MTTGMLSNNRPECYLPRRQSRDTCTAGTGAHLLQESSTPGTLGGIPHIKLARMVRGTHSPQKANSVKKREGGFNTAQYSFPLKPQPGHARGHRLATRDPRTRWLLPAGTDVLCRTQAPTPDGASRHQSMSRAALTILTAQLSSATQTQQPRNPQNTARYGARQAGRHEHEHCTNKPEQHPRASMGSTGTHQGGPTGPCHRRNCTYELHRRS